MIRVLIADDQHVVRMGFRMVVDGETDMSVVGEAVDGAAAVEAAEELRPDVVLMDVRMPRLDGIAATSTIAARCPETDVLVVTTFALDEYVVSALRAGAAGFLLKNIEPVALIDAIRIVVDGDALVAPSVTRALIDYAVRHDDEPNRTATRAMDPELLDRLSPREREVLASMARGLSNAEVAGELYLGETTIKSHVSNLLSKLHLRSRVQAVVLAYELGLVRPGHVGYDDLLRDV